MVTLEISCPEEERDVAEELLRRLQVFLKATPSAPDRVKIMTPGKSTSRGKGAKIRCPRCKWQPAKSDRWGCECGWSWNTFDTRGQCPQCGKQWQVTQCLSCHEFSAHEVWYAKDEEGG